MIPESPYFTPLRGAARDHTLLRNCALAAPSAAASRYIHRLEEEVSALTQQCNTACNLLRRAVIVQDLSTVVIDELEGRSSIVEEESTLRSNTLWLCMYVMAVLKRVVQKNITDSGLNYGSRVDVSSMLDLGELPERIIRAIRSVFEQGNERVTELVGAVPKKVCMALAAEEARSDKLQLSSCASHAAEVSNGFAALQRHLERVLSRVEELLSEFSVAQRRITDYRREDCYQEESIASLQKAVMSMEHSSLQISELMRLFQEVRLDRLQNHPAAVMGAPEPQPKISKVCLPACTQTAGPPPASSASTQASPPPSSAAETQTVPPPLCSNDGRSGADSAAVTKTVSAVSAVTATTQTNVVATKVVETQTAPLPVLTADAPPSAAPQEKVPVVTQSKSSVATQTIGVISPATDGATAPTSASLKDSGSTSEWKILVDFSLGALDMLASHFGEYVSNTEKVLNLSEREMEQMRQEGNKKSKVVWESLVEEKQVELDRLRDEVKRLRNLSGSAKGNSEESTAGDLRGEDSKVSMLLRMYVKYAAPFIPPRFKAARNTKLTPIADMRKAAVRAGARCVNAGYSPVREEKAAAARPKGNEKTVGKDEGSDSRSPSVQPVAVNVSKRIIAGSPAPSSSLPNRCVSTDDTLLSVASQKAFIVPVALPPVRKTTNKNLDDDSPVVTYKESPEERKSAPAAGKEERKAPVAGTKSTTKPAAPSSTAAVSIGGGVLTVRKFNKGGSPSSSSSTTPRKAGKTAPEASRKAPVKEETDDDSFDRNEKPKVRAQQTQPRKQSKTQPPATDSWSDSLSDVSEPRKASAKQPSNVDVVARNSFDVTSEDDVKDPPKKAAVPSSAAAKDDKKTAGKTEQKGKDHAKQRERRWSESSSSEEDTKFKKIDTFGAKKAAQSDTKKAATTHADKIGQKGSKKSSHSFDDSQSLDSSLTLTL